jgi:hypothetical protein
MIPTLAVTAGLLLQLSGGPVRVWRDDSTAYVSLTKPGHLVLMHVDAIGRIRVLLPVAPDEATAASGNAPVAVTLPSEAQGNPTTFIAIESRWPFDFSALRLGADWDYDGAWLLQPTGGDPLAALLDIADRITDGRPYDYGVAAYSRAGVLVARGPVAQPDVCLSCVRHGTAVAAAPAPIATNAVDCSNASLTNAFCGVNSGTVSISAPAPAQPQVVYQPAPAPQAVYVPYFVPVSRGIRSRFEQPVMPAPAPRSFGAAYPVAPRLVVPSPSQIGTFTGRHR